MIAGVAAGIARSIGVDPLVVRIAFVLLAVSGGFGVVVYVALWLAVPDEQGTRVAIAAPRDARERSQRALAFGLIVLGGLLLMRELGLWAGDRLVWPAVLGAAGLALAWPGASERPGWRGFSTRLPGSPLDVVAGGRASLLRIGLGLVAVAAGAALFVVVNEDLGAFGQGVLAVAVTVLGLVLIFGPWWWRLARDLLEERRERIRSQERAEVAAQIHDSVLQTLALIQRRADDATETARLARRQERDLRAWLFGGTPPVPHGLGAAVQHAAEEVEDLYGIAVEVVMVGDCPAEERLEGLVLAAKEALVNAAKFSGTPTVSVYVEVEPDRVGAFVRDRGRGFDPEAVPDDRKGISESIHGRMQRHGGRAVVRSQPGAGTEVELLMPRSPR